MAVNPHNKRYLIKKILPKVDFLVTTQGVQILCDRITTPRLLKFDKPGRCSTCKSDSVEISFCVEKRGVWVDCTRIKDLQFVPFDLINDFPRTCIFRLKSKARIFSIPHETEGDDDPAPVSEVLPTTRPNTLSPFLNKFDNQSSVLSQKSINDRETPSPHLSEAEEDEIVFLGQKPGHNKKAKGGKPTANIVKQEIIEVNEQPKNTNINLEPDILGEEADEIDGDEEEEEEVHDDDHDQLGGENDGTGHETGQVDEGSENKNGELSVGQSGINAQKRKGEDAQQTSVIEKRGKYEGEEIIDRIFWERKF